MRDVTLLFLRRGGEVLLAMKKRGFGEGKWNGVGGKVEPGEALEQATIRECQEEIGVTPGPLRKIGVLNFYFAHKPEWNQKMHVYETSSWEGEPQESEEMAPQWYKLREVPYAAMWDGDELWMPHVLHGKCVHADFTFDDHSIVTKYNLTVADEL